MIILHSHDYYYKQYERTRTQGKSVGQQLRERMTFTVNNKR